MNARKLALLQLLLIISINAHEEPNCEFACTPNADCVGENQCRCRSGYIDDISLDTGTPYCKPICQSNCPHGHCVAPDECECTAGFQPSNGSCEPTTLTTANTIVEGKTVSVDEALTTSTTEGEYINELYVVSAEPDSECPPTYLNVNGTCRPEVYDECDPKLCGPNALCNDNGKCICQPGYTWGHPIGENAGTSQQCLSLVSANRNEKRHEFFYIALGTTCLIIALIVLVAVLLRNY